MSGSESNMLRGIDSILRKDFGLANKAKQVGIFAGTISSDHSKRLTTALEYMNHMDKFSLGVIGGEKILEFVEEGYYEGFEDFVLMRYNEPEPEEPLGSMDIERLKVSVKNKYDRAMGLLTKEMEDVTFVDIKQRHKAALEDLNASEEAQKETHAKMMAEVAVAEEKYTLARAAAWEVVVNDPENYFVGDLDEEAYKYKLSKNKWTKALEYKRPLIKEKFEALIKEMYWGLKFTLSGGARALVDEIEKSTRVDTKTSSFVPLLKECTKKLYKRFVQLNDEETSYIQDALDRKFDFSVDLETMYAVKSQLLKLKNQLTGDSVSKTTLWRDFILKKLEFNGHDLGLELRSRLYGELRGYKTKEELDEVEQNKADEGLDVALQILEGVEERETEEFEKDK